MHFIAANFAPIMFVGLICFLILGFPVAFSLGAAGLFFGVLGVWLDIFPQAILSVLPLRLIGIMSNETLLAVPFFTLMGLILERSGMAEDLLESVGQVFGPLRGGLALAGAAVTMLGMLLPSCVLTYSATRWAHRNRTRRAVRAFKVGMAPIVIALLIATGWLLTVAHDVPTRDWPLWLLTAVVTLIVWRTRVHLLWLIAGGALAGLLGWV